MQDLNKNIISIGQINFIEHFPINYAFKKWHKENLRFTNAYPVMINNLFKEEQLHIAPISSIEYLKNQKELELINTICIGSESASSRAVLFSKYKIEDLNKKRIAVPYTSASSIELLKVILKEYGVEVNSAQFEKHKYQKNLQDHLKEKDAILYTGNKALIESLAKHNEIYTYDLSYEWNKITDLPFVFTVWISWKDWKNAREDDFSWLSFLFDKAVEASFTIYFNEIVEEINKKYKIDKSEINKFLKDKIQYKMTPKHLHSMGVFYEKYGML